MNATRTPSRSLGVAQGTARTPRERKSPERVEAPGFETINRGFDTVFRPNRLSLGLVVPLETYVTSPVPTMERHSERVELAEEVGFSAVWLRDVPFNVPSFGDAGQVYDPFVYLGFLAARTERIALGVASIILPLRHPAHVAKAAASADVLSGGRLILGVASGDRPAEYPALSRPFEDRDARFCPCRQERERKSSRFKDVCWLPARPSPLRIDAENAATTSRRAAPPSAV